MSSAACSGEYEALLLVERSRSKHLLRLLRPVALSASTACGVMRNGAAALLGLRLSEDVAGSIARERPAHPHVAFSRSTSPHFKPSSSPRLMPVWTAST